MRTSRTTSRASTPSRTSTPEVSARATSSCVTPGGSATAVLPAGDHAENVVHVQTLDEARVEAVHRHPSPAAARRAARAPRARLRSSQGTWSRPARRAAFRAPRRSRSTRGPGAPPPRSRTVGAHHPLPCRMSPTRLAALREDDVVSTLQSESVRDAGANRAAPAIATRAMHSSDFSSSSSVRGDA